MCLLRILVCMLSSGGCVLALVMNLLVSAVD